MKYTYLLLAASIGLLAGCSQVEQDSTNADHFSDGDLVEKVIFEVLPIKDGDDPETKASAVPNGGTVGFVWEATDTVGIYPDKGSQVFFNIEDGVGTSSVSFTGGGWALKQNSTYTSYYPFVGDIYLKRDKIPVSFAGQKQIGTTSPFVGARYYLATEASTSEHGVLRFSYSTLNTIINVNATLPAGTYTKMSLTIEEPLFIEEGTYSLDERTIVGTKFTNTLEIELEDVVLTEEATIPVYIMSAPVDLREKEVVVRFMAADGMSYSSHKNPSKAYMAGTRYGLTCDEIERDSQPIPEAIDLGLSVKWASFNLGASKPEEYGDYFAWGEVSPRSVVPEGAHAWSIYELCNGEYAHMLKYNTNPSYGDVDGLSILEIVDDAAAVTLRGSWRMPTAEELDELLESCDWNWTSKGNVYGYEVVSKVNGNSVFLPAAGYKGDDSYVSEAGETGLYWSSSLTKGYQTYTAQRLRFTDGEIDEIDINRSFALQIRPVWDELLSPAVVFADPNFETYCIENFDTNGNGEISYSEAEMVTFIDVTSMGITSLQGIECFTNLTDLSCGENQLTTLDVSKNTALTKLNCRYNLLISLDVLNNTALIDLDCSYNQLTSLLTNNDAMTWLSCQFNQLTTLDVSHDTSLIYLYCRNNQLTSLDVSYNPALTNLICSPMNDNLDNNLLGTLFIASGQSIQNVTENRSILHIPSETQIFVKLEAVDLGLPSGIKWASSNLGANRPEDFGDYYAWGDPTPYYSSQNPLMWKEGKESGYSWTSYKWCMGSYINLTKYCTDSEFGDNGFTDGKTVLDLDDDAAHVILGGKWRMPTSDEWSELMNNSSVIWTTENGVNGCRFTSRHTGNSIFLPASGYRFSSSLGNVNDNCLYWSSSLSEGDPGSVWLFFSTPDNSSMWVYARQNGFSIRPVTE